MVTRKTKNRRQVKGTLSYSGRDERFGGNSLAGMVTLAQDGDRICMDRLARIFQPQLSAYFYSMTKDADLTADLLQETLYRMVKCIDTLKNPASFRSWLFRIASNLLRNHYRQKGRLSFVKFSMMEEYQLENMLEDDSREAHRAVCRKEVVSLVARAMARLTETSRSVITLRCRDKQSYAQISRRLGCSETSARAQFSRAKQKIRRYLQLDGIVGI